MDTLEDRVIHDISPKNRELHHSLDHSIDLVDSIDVKLIFFIRIFYRHLSFYIFTEIKSSFEHLSGRGKLHIHATYKNRCSLSWSFSTNQISSKVYHYQSIDRMSAIQAITGISLSDLSYERRILCLTCNFSRAFRHGTCDFSSPTWTSYLYLFKGYSDMVSVIF